MQTAAGAIAGGVCGVAGIVALGLTAPSVMRGPQALLIGGAAGLLAALLLRLGWAPARIVGATIGGAVGALFALTFVEWTGEFDRGWALRGGGYGLMFGVPLAAFLGGLGGFLRGAPRA